MTHRASDRDANLVAPAFVRVARALACVACIAALAACGGAGGGSANAPAASSNLGPAAQLGEKIFRDTTLSASGKLACISCHDPANGHASPFDTPVTMGGPNLDQPGTRTSPSLRYLRFNTPFSFASDGAPAGGFFWDGRANTLAEQARAPFLNPFEMANPDVAAVVAKLASAPYASQFRAVFGDGIFSDSEAAFDRARFALERYQREDAVFASFNSKYDAFIAGRTTLAPQELNGFALFNRPDKGNCAACHPSAKPVNAPGALFTDFTYDNLGVPRNPAIPANADPAYRDGGLCGMGRPDLAARNDLCGAFKVPTLRNVALRKHFFHNGRLKTLEDAVTFYVKRDTNPEIWYSTDALGVMSQ